MCRNSTPGRGTRNPEDEPCADKADSRKRILKGAADDADGTREPAAI